MKRNLLEMPTGDLKISPSLALPLDAVTQKIAFLGRTGSGKTYGATKVAEEMLTAGAQIVAIDPVGVWFGLRLRADGISPGLDIPVFGGLRGDLPIEPHAGALIADVIIDRCISAVIDVSMFGQREQARFATDLATRLFDRRKAAPSAMMIFLEECQEFIPQNPMKGEEHMLHAFQRLGKIGRNFGIGLSLISQRPQEVSKKVLNQTECLFAFQMTGVHERRAIREWVNEKGLEENIVDILPRLEVGHAHVWSPQWLKISERIQIAKKATYNASSTPTVGVGQAEIGKLQPIDLAALKAQMAETIERAKAEDPTELRKRIAELERELRATPAPASSALELQDAREQGFAAGQLDGVRLENARLVGIFQSAVAQSKLDGADYSSSPLDRQLPPQRPDPTQSGRSQTPVETIRPRPERLNPTAVGNSEIGAGGLRRILTALAQRPQGLSAKQIGIRAGLSSGSGTFGTYLGKARSSGWIEGGRDRLMITLAGLGALGSYDPLPSGQALLEYWLGELGESGAARMLRSLADAYPRPLSAGELGSRAGISHSSGTFGTYLGKLRSLELIEGSRDALRMSEELAD